MTLAWAEGGVAVIETMGTVASLRSSRAFTPTVLADVAACFDAHDRRFSLYRDDSELSRVNRREVLMPHASAELRAMWELAETWRVRTDGAFTPHRPDGVVDLSGVVKAVAIRDALALLVAAGWGDVCVNVGGDVQVRGSDRGPDGEVRPWLAGIVDPANRARLLSQAELGVDLPAIATSGSAERGEHIWRVGSDDTFCQVSVVGPDIVTADVLATAVMAGGVGALGLVEEYGCEVLAVTSDGHVRATAMFLA